MKRLPRWVIWTASPFLFFIAVALIFPIFGRSRDNHHGSCQSNLKQIMLGIKQYTQDYDEKFPPLSINTQEGWLDVIYPYLKSTQIFQCPSAEKPTNQHQSDYFYNAHFAQISEAEVDDSASTIIMGDGQDNASANAHISELPLDWLTEDKSPAHRHLDGANYTFADGHVKWLPPEKVTPATFIPHTPAFVTPFHR